VARVESPPATHCAGDWDYRGDVNSADFFSFLSHFLRGMGAFNESGETSSEDFFEFLAAFFAGCS
jgi:hypothetical protein